jgi:hypothetical protein
MSAPGWGCCIGCEDELWLSGRIAIGLRKRCEEGMLPQQWIEVGWCGIHFCFPGFSGFLAFAGFLCAGCMGQCKSLWELEQQIEVLIYARVGRGRFKVQSQGPVAIFFSFANPAHDNRAASRATPWLHRRNLRGTKSATPAMVYKQTRHTNRASLASLGHPSEGQGAPNPATCLEISIHLATTRRPYAHPHASSSRMMPWMRGCIQYAFQI